MRHQAHKVSSPTQASAELYLQESGRLDRYVEALPAHPGQCGSLVQIDGRCVCVDYVSRSEVHDELYPKLLRGYALEALNPWLDMVNQFGADTGRVPGVDRVGAAAGPRPDRGGHDPEAGRRRGGWARACPGRRASRAERACCVTGFTGRSRAPVSLQRCQRRQSSARGLRGGLTRCF
jgi:hypothetical protein